MKSYASLSVLLSLVLLSACVPTIIGRGAGFSIAYVAGELQAQEELGIDDAWLATIRALERLELVVKDQDKDALSAKAVAYGADEKKVTVRLRRDSANITSFKIRIGLWGDQEFSMTILDQIEAEAGLGVPGAPVKPTAPVQANQPKLPVQGPAPVARDSLY